MAEPARPLSLPKRDDARSWLAQGMWTYEDYRRLPDDGQRYEVISPRTRRFDLDVKLSAYQEAGVSEIWFADPKRRTIVVHGLSEDRKSYAEISRGGEWEAVASRILPGLRVEISEIFAPPLE